MLIKLSTVYDLFLPWTRIRSLWWDTLKPCKCLAHLHTSLRFSGSALMGSYGPMSPEQPPGPLSKPLVPRASLPDHRVRLAWLGVGKWWMEGPRSPPSRAAFPLSITHLSMCGPSCTPQGGEHVWMGTGNWEEHQSECISPGQKLTHSFLYSVMWAKLSTYVERSPLVPKSYLPWTRSLPGSKLWWG